MCAGVGDIPRRSRVQHAVGSGDSLDVQIDSYDHIGVHFNDVPSRTWDTARVWAVPGIASYPVLLKTNDNDAKKRFSGVLFASNYLNSITPEVLFEGFGNDMKDLCEAKVPWGMSLQWAPEATYRYPNTLALWHTKFEADFRAGVRERAERVWERHLLSGARKAAMSAAASRAPDAGGIQGWKVIMYDKAPCQRERE